MPNYNSIADAVHAYMDKLIANGIMHDEKKKSPDLATAINNLVEAHLAQLDDETRVALELANADLDHDIADQMSFLLDIMGHYATSANPLTALEADGDIPANVDIWGPAPSDLQEDIVVDGHNITGTLKQYDGYTNFSNDPDLQSGHYLVLHFAVPGVTGAKITVEADQKVTLDDDGIYICIVRNLSTPITVTATKEGYGPITKVYSMKGLTLA